jgi:hypothetical protein
MLEHDDSDSWKWTEYILNYEMDTRILGAMDGRLWFKEVCLAVKLDKGWTCG